MILHYVVAPRIHRCVGPKRAGDFSFAHIGRGDVEVTDARKQSILHFFAEELKHRLCRRIVEQAEVLADLVVIGLFGTDFWLHPILLVNRR